MKWYWVRSEACNTGLVVVYEQLLSPERTNKYVQILESALDYFLTSSWACDDEIGWLNIEVFD